MAIDIKIRLAQRKDVQSLVQLLNSALAKKLKLDDTSWGDGLFTEEEIVDLMNWGSVYVAETNNTLIGTVTMVDSDEIAWGSEKGLDDKALYIHKLASTGETQSRSVGRLLLEYCEAIARSMSKEFLRLDCPSSNKKLCEYYESLGFQKVGENTEYSGQDPEFNTTDTYVAALFEKRITKSHS